MWVWACLFRDVLGDTKHTVDTPLPIRSFNSHVSRMVRPARYQTGKAGSVSQQSPQPTSLVVAWHLVASRTSRRRRIITINNSNSNNIVHCKLHCFFFWLWLCVCNSSVCSIRIHQSNPSFAHYWNYTVIINGRGRVPRWRYSSVVASRKYPHGGRKHGSTTPSFTECESTIRSDPQCFISSSE